MSFAHCTKVTPECPVSETIFGDYFTLGATASFSAIYGLLLVAQIGFMYKAKLWSFGAWLFCGMAFECVGYICRCLMVDNPWNDDAFMGQQITLVLGPTLIAAAISLTFKHLVLWYGPEHSLIKPKFYPVVFVGSDLVSIAIQGAGGGIASGANENQSQADLGNNMLLAGVCFQVVNMVFCGGLILAYVWRRKKATTEGPTQMSSEWHEGRQNVPPCYQGTWQEVQQRQKKVKIFIYSLAVAYVAIVCRCIYRIPEMASGWGSSLMQNEATFMILDGGLILIACLTLTIFHPLFWFPFMCKQGWRTAKQDDTMEMSSADGLMQAEAGNTTSVKQHK